MTMQNDINHYQPYESRDDFHGVMTYTFGELLDIPGGVDWDNTAWSWRNVAYDDTQYVRCCKKIENRFYDRELGVLPASRWKRHFLRLIDEIMPTLKPLYAAVDGNSGIMLSDGIKCAPCFPIFPQRNWPKTKTTQATRPTTNTKQLPTVTS